MVAGFFSTGQDKNAYDPQAIVMLDKMSQFISGLKSCSFVLHTATDRVYNGITQTENNTSEVHLGAPNKMFINVKGDKGHRSYYYNGKTLSYYSFLENNYTRVHAPTTVLETFDTISSTYGIDFPAADFFYPDFTDDLVANSAQIELAGKKEIEGKPCFHIVASSSSMNVQIWISDDTRMLPKKVVINYYDGKLVKRYEGDFSGWKINPALQAPMFEFKVPPGAKEVYLMPGDLHKK